MKKIIIASVTSLMLLSTNANAGYVVPKEAVKTEVANGNYAAGNDVLIANENAGATETVNTVINKEHKKGFFSKIFKGGGSDSIPKPLYVVLAILGLGWLAMGINDNFEGWDWVISLVLYLLAYIPGLIYTLIMMKNYY